MNHVFRIAAIGSLLASLLLCLFAVRSYSHADRLHGHMGPLGSFLLASKEGRIVFVTVSGANQGIRRWMFVSFDVNDELSFPLGPMEQHESWLGFGWMRDPLYMVMRSTIGGPRAKVIHIMGAASTSLRGAGPIVPYWFAILLSALASGLLGWPRAWRPRFSLRSMLIVTTLVAAGLALLALIDAW